MSDPFKNAFIQEACKDLLGVGGQLPKEVAASPAPAMPQLDNLDESSKDDLRTDFAQAMFDPKAIKDGLKSLYRKQPVSEAKVAETKRDFKSEANDETADVLQNILKGMK